MTAVVPCWFFATCPSCLYTGTDKVHRRHFGISVSVHYLAVSSHKTRFLYIEDVVPERGRESLGERERKREGESWRQRDVGRENEREKDKERERDPLSTDTKQ